MNRPILSAPWAAALFCILAYCLSLAELFRRGLSGDAVAVLLIFGGLMSALVWAATRSQIPAAPASDSPGLQLSAILLLTVLVALWLCLGIDFVNARLATATWDPRLQVLLKLASKLVVFVAIPWALFRRRFGATAADFGLSWEHGRALIGPLGLKVLGLMAAMMAINLAIGSAAAPIRHGEISPLVLGVALPFCLLWNCVEAGLVEEFFFRALLQTKLTDWSRSRTTGTLVMAVIFGLFHAPGLVLRGAASFEGMGASPTPILAVAYSVAIMGVAALPFGLLWARSRNLWMAILVHGACDTVAHLPTFIQTWAHR